MLPVLHSARRPPPHCLRRPPPRRRTYAKRTLASIERGPAQDGITPRPETVADQVHVALAVVGRFVKYSAYAGAVLGVATLAGFVGMNAWVELVEMPPASGGNADPHFGWEEDCEIGWSGAYLGKGTDPRLGARARLLLRSAWIAQHWQSGQSASAIASTAGLGMEEGMKTVQLVDSGYLIAAKSLSRALHHVEEHAHLRLDRYAPPDRALVEIEERLAEVKELIGTRDALIDARRAYERIWEACVGQMEREGRAGRAGETWEGREAMRVAGKIAEVGIKAAALARPGSKAVEEDLSRAQDILLWAATTGLGVAVKDGEAIRRAERDREHQFEKRSPSGGLFAWGSRRQPAVAAAVVPVRPEVDLLLLGLGALAQSKDDARSALAELTPSAARSTVAALLALSSLVVPSDLPRAHDLQRSVRRLLDHVIIAPSSPDVTAATLHNDWLRVRRNLAAVYGAEVGRARGGPGGGTLEACKAVILDSDTVARTLSDASTAATAAASNAALAPGKGRLSAATLAIEKDARMTGTLAANLAGVINEVDCPLAGSVSSSAVPVWCGPEGGDVTAIEFYKTAMRFASGLGGRGGSAQRGQEEGGEEGMEGEGRMWRESYENLVRVREGMRKRAKGNTGNMG